MENLLEYLSHSKTLGWTTLIAAFKENEQNIGVTLCNSEVLARRVMDMQYEHNVIGVISDFFNAVSRYDGKEKEVILQSLSKAWAGIGEVLDKHNFHPLIAKNYNDEKVKLNNALYFKAIAGMYFLKHSTGSAEMLKADAHFFSECVSSYWDHLKELVKINGQNEVWIDTERAAVVLGDFVLSLDSINAQKFWDAVSKMNKKSLLELRRGTLSHVITGLRYEESKQESIFQLADSLFDIKKQDFEWLFNEIEQQSYILAPHAKSKGIDLKDMVPAMLSDVFRANGMSEQYLKEIVSISPECVRNAIENLLKGSSGHLAVRIHGPSRMDPVAGLYFNDIRRWSWKYLNEMSKMIEGDEVERLAQVGVVSAGRRDKSMFLKCIEHDGVLDKIKEISPGLLSDVISEKNFGPPHSPWINVDFSQIGDETDTIIEVACILKEAGFRCSGKPQRPEMEALVESWKLEKVAKKSNKNEVKRRI